MAASPARDEGTLAGADHTLDDAKGGTTDPANGNPRCRRHNQAKHCGDTVQRDALGEFHTYRPDGTEIG